MADLIFSRPRHAGGPVNLVFGAGPGVVVPDPVTVSGVGTLGGLSGYGVATYDNRNPRRASTTARAPHQVAERATAQAVSGWGLSARILASPPASWGVAAPRTAAPVSSWAVSGHAASERAAPWGQGTARALTAALVHQSAAARATQNRAAWAEAQGRAVQAALVHQAARSLLGQATAPWGLAARLQALAVARYGSGTARAAQLRALWETARPVPPGREPWPPANPNPVLPRVPSTHLVFACPPWMGGAVQLVFGHVCQVAPSLVTVPRRAYYMTINSVTLRRVAGNVFLPAHAFQMALDADSWTWSWGATLDLSAEAAVQPDASGEPVELEAVVNGVPYRLRVGRVGRSRQFPTTRLAVSGQGLASLLAGPHAPVGTFASTTSLTAQQLMALALTVNGQANGWAVDFGLTDWLVPAGAWTFQGTPIQALQDIAGAAGGYLQPHPTAQTIRVLPRYPVAPWEWGAVVPDLELPGSVVEVESMEWIEKPSYNRVFIGGVSGGVFGPVTRAGSAGDLLAPQVTHPLVTHADAHRQRGLAVLADTGRQVHMSLKLPVLPETGLILPGQMVRYAAEQNRTGIVRSVSVDWSSPVMRQTIGVESHAA